MPYFIYYHIARKNSLTLRMKFMHMNFVYFMNIWGKKGLTFGFFYNVLTNPYNVKLKVSGACNKSSQRGRSWIVNI